MANKMDRCASKILNTAFYRFVPLSNLEFKRAQLKAMIQGLGQGHEQDHGLKGTVLLSPEGVNGFIAGEESRVRKFQGLLLKDPDFSGLQFKDSFSDSIPFKRLRIKIKKEIIPVRDRSIDPAKLTAPYLSPQALKQWIDEKREFLFLDTRNRYETSYGTFKDAQELGIGHFQEFSEKLGEFGNEKDKTRPLVMFCTGGIRCEKASVIALKQGFQSVFQLDGGILNYFKECGGAHYNGSCFVFDERVALDPDLKPIEESTLKEDGELPGLKAEEE